jgi:hypothetical protein
MERQNAPQPKLMARWIEVEGKLICKWETTEPQQKQDILIHLPIIAQAA